MRMCLQIYMPITKHTSLYGKMQTHYTSYTCNMLSPISKTLFKMMGMLGQSFQYSRMYVCIKYNYTIEKKEDICHYLCPSLTCQRLKE